MERADLEDERTRSRAAVASLYENYIGQEGRGAAEEAKKEALRKLEAEYRATDAKIKRREALFNALASELASAMPANVADPVLIIEMTMRRPLVRSLVYAIADGTWEPRDA